MENWKFQPTFSFKRFEKLIQPGDPMATLLTILYIQFEITLLTNEIINNTIDNEGKKLERLNEILNEANAYDEQINSIIQTAFKTKSVTRNEVIQQCMSIKVTAHQFKDILLK